MGPSDWSIVDRSWNHTSDANTLKRVLTASDLLSCQVVQVGRLLLMDLEVPKRSKPKNKRKQRNTINSLH